MRDSDVQIQQKTGFPTSEWIIGFGNGSRPAYERALDHWLTWCHDRAYDPLDVSETGITTAIASLYADHLAEQECEPCRDGRYSATTMSKHLSAVASWYGHLARAGRVPVSPFVDSRRPRVDRDVSTSRDLTAGEVDAIRRAAAALRGPYAARHRAVIEVLAALGIRVSELCALRLSGYGRRGAGRTLRVEGKRGRVRVRSIPPPAEQAIGAYLNRRADDEVCELGELTGHLFVTTSGKPLGRTEVYRLVRRVAATAGITDRIGPHAFRHAFVTRSRDAGAPIADIQAALGHATAATTLRYDHGRSDRDPSRLLYRTDLARAAAGGQRSPNAYGDGA